MAMTRTQRRPLLPSSRNGGFALLVAVIFMSVMLAFSLALNSLGYKQVVLASTAKQSQYAFYAADAGLECALYADQQMTDPANANLPLLRYDPSITIFQTAPYFTCDGRAPFSGSPRGSRVVVPEGTPGTTLHDQFRYQFSLDSATHCVDVTIYKYEVKQPSGYSTYIFSQGYDVPCAVVNSPTPTTRYSSRGLQAHY